MLIGEYTHTIDDKNRLSLPSKFRKEMGKEIVVTPGLDGCLFAFTKAQWKKISSELSEASMLGSDARSFNRYMFGGATEVSIDSIGRILVPDFLKKRANLKSKAIVIGVQDRIEIWNQAQWSEYKARVEKEANTLAEKLSTVGAL